MKMTKLPDSNIRLLHQGIQRRAVYYQGYMIYQFFNWDLYREVVQAKALEILNQ